MAWDKQYQMPVIVYNSLPILYTLLYTVGPMSGLELVCTFAVITDAFQINQNIATSSFYYMRLYEALCISPTH